MSHYSCLAVRKHSSHFLDQESGQRFEPVFSKSLPVLIGISHYVALLPQSSLETITPPHPFHCIVRPVTSSIVHALI